MSEFDDATHVHPDGSAAIVDGWDIGGNANGGYLLALAARHMRDVSGCPDPITVTAHYLAPGTAGPVTVVAEVVKTGNRLTTMTGSLRRDGRTILQVIGAFGDAAADRHAFALTTISPPELLPLDECVRRTTDGVVPVPMSERLDVRLRPGDAPFGGAARSGVGEVAGWFGFADGRPIDTLALLFVGDALPPAVFNLDGPPGWVPTIEYTVHVRGVPAPGYVRCVFRTYAIGGGYLQEDGEVWDSADRLVAMTRQLGLMARG